MMVIVILIFLAALAALGLPWSLTDCFVIVLDSKPSSLPDQIEILQNWWGSLKQETLPDQQKHKDKDKCKDKDNDNDNYI